jgi:serine/threonine-protein kinase RsbW
MTKPSGEPQTERIGVTIPSRLDFLGILNHTITELGDYLKLEEEVIDALAIAVIEAGTNAIQHGSPNAPSDAVEFSFEVNSREVNVVVRDRGAGFEIDVDPAPPTQGDQLFDSRGRGIFLMRSFMDRVDFEFSGGGTMVTLYKARPGGNGAAD